MEKAYGYLRVSSPGQIEGTGIARQGDKISQFAEGRFDLQGLFIEWGVSGTLDAAGRPALAEALERCKTEDGPRVIIVENADRWGRDTIVSLLLFKECEECGIRVVSADSGQELTAGNDPTSKLLQQVQSAVAEYQKSQLVVRMRLARERLKRETGGKRGKEGVKAYGDLPGEEIYLPEITKLCTISKSSADFQNHLNRAGVPTRNGKPWARSSAYKLRKRVLARLVEVSLPSPAQEPCLQV